MNDYYRGGLSKAERSQKFSVKTVVVCECGKVCPPGPMAKHTKSSGHKVVKD
jgi:hypothetical protein